MIIVLAVLLQLFSLKIDPSVKMMSDWGFRISDFTLPKSQITNPKSQDPSVFSMSQDRYRTSECLVSNENNWTKVAHLVAPSDIAGHWEGTITRDEGGGKRTVFKMELDLTQNGKDVTGISYVHAEGTKRIYSASMSLVGRVNKNYLKYEEQKILNYDPIPDAEWCVKKCELRYSFLKGTTPTLEGIWEGKAGSTGSCIPGRIFLQKKPARV